MGHTILAKFRLINSSKQFHSLSNLEKEIEINQNDTHYHLHLQKLSIFVPWWQVQYAYHRKLSLCRILPVANEHTVAHVDFDTIDR